MDVSPPRIGITTSFSDGEQHLDRRYVLAVERAGGLPLPAPMLATDAAADAFAALLDGLVVIGGPAVTEGLDGALPPDLDPTDPVRTASDRRLLQAFLRDGDPRPVLGICYGMQLMSGLLGGRLWGDVEREHAGAAVHSQKRGGTEHPVAFAPGTVLGTLFPAPVSVNTRHLQALRTPGAGLVASGHAPDGVIEAVESPDGRLLGVQFHPERMGAAMDPLFQTFIHRAARGSKRGPARRPAPPASALH